MTVSGLLQIPRSKEAVGIRMKEENDERAIEVTTVDSGYLIPLGPPKSCSEHFLHMLPTRDRTLEFYPRDSIPYWLIAVS